MREGDNLIVIGVDVVDHEPYFIFRLDQLGMLQQLLTARKLRDVLVTGALHRQDELAELVFSQDPMPTLVERLEDFTEVTQEVLMLLQLVV